MRTEQGDFHDLDVSDHLTVRGAASGTTTVRSGGHLVVQGDFDGALHVEDDGTVTLQGNIEGVVVTNDGLILVAGMVSWGFTDVPGRVAVCHGSLLTGYAQGPVVLRADGSVGPVRDDGKVDITDSIENYCYYVDAEQGFVPVSDYLS